MNQEFLLGARAATHNKESEQSPGAWLDTAATLLACAEHIDSVARSAEVRLTELNRLEQSRTPPVLTEVENKEYTRLFLEEWCKCGVAFMLFGMAIECLLKLLILLDGRRWNHNRHDLGVLATEAGLDFSTDKNMRFLLHRLTTMIERGRYPVPRGPKEVQINLVNRDELNRLFEAINKRSTELRGPSPLVIL